MEFLGLRWAGNRSILNVCEDLPTEHNNKNQQPKGAEGVEFLGLRRSENRSILNVCEDLPTEHNDKITTLCNF